MTTLAFLAAFFLQPLDFVQYWSAAKVNLLGGDPYDAEVLLPWQRAAGDPERSEATMLWNPPWSLAVYAPFALLEPRLAHTVWILVQITLVFTSSLLLWVHFAGLRRLWLLAPFAITLLCAPVVWLVIYGQNLGFMLFGLSGFLLLREKRPFAAGVVGALTSLKPHLLVPFAVVLLVDSRSRDGRRVLYGGCSFIFAASMIALIQNPEVFRHCFDAFMRPTSTHSVSPADWELPLFAYRLRWLISPDTGKPFLLQFIPCVLASIAVTVYRLAFVGNWNWSKELPGLTMFSLATAPYGGWIFDDAILLVPAIALFARAAREGYAPVTMLASCGWFLLNLQARTMHSLEDTIWYVPAFIVWYLVVVLALKLQDKDATTPAKE